MPTEKEIQLGVLAISGWLVAFVVVILFTCCDIRQKSTRQCGSDTSLKVVAEVESSTPPMETPDLHLNFGRVVVKDTELYGVVAGFEGDKYVSEYFLHHEQGWEADLMAVASKLVKDNSTVLDIGANIGASSLEINRVMKASGVDFVMVEIQADVLGVLKFNTRTIPRRRIYGGAVSSSRVPMTYEDMSENDNVGGLNCDRVSPHKKKNDPRSMMVAGSFSLDDFQLDQNVSLVKIDIEGSESLLFEGEANLAWWRRVRPDHVIIEAWTTNKHEVFTGLESVGYQGVETWGDDHLFEPGPVLAPV
jgi:FkbM family methyltransferase